MTSANLNSTTKALAAMDLIKLTGERGARAVTYRQTNTLEGTLATVHSAFCAIKLTGGAGVELTKLADSVIVSMNNGASLDIGTLLYDSILPISRITSDIL